MKAVWKRKGKTADEKFRESPEEDIWRMIIGEVCLETNDVNRLAAFY